MTEPGEDADVVAGPTEVTEVSLEALDAVSGGAIGANFAFDFIQR